MQTKFNFSIIIPHHGTPDLLERCLQSIPTREDIQLIVIEDTEGRGAGIARNQGLEQAKGKWVIFADADDYFTPHAFDIIDKHIEDDVDVVYYNAISRFTDTGEPAIRANNLQRMIQEFVTSDAKKESDLRFNFHEPWAKMIRRSFIEAHQLQFDATRWANDVMFTTKVGCFAKTIAVDPAPIYCITVTNGSLVNQRSIESRRCRYEVMLRANQFLREQGLGQYQHSLMYSLRRAACYGPKVLLDFIRLGKRYNAQFFVGWGQWINNAIYTIFHNEDKVNAKYIIRE